MLLKFILHPGPDSRAKHMAAVFGIPMHRVEIDITRLGGGFGGKEDQATAWAVFCALAAWHLKKPVEVFTTSHGRYADDGKRNPYSSDFKIGLDETWR